MSIIVRLKQFATDPVESVLMQAPRALVASVLALIVDFAILVFCVRVLGMPAIPSAILGYLVGGVIQYVLCSIWVFSVSLKNEGFGFVAFTILSLVGLGITWVVVASGEWVGTPVELAKGGAVVLAFSWNFLSRKYLLFRPAAQATAQPTA